jgi:tetratricopeptide (TPR) repeat protein
MLYDWGYLPYNNPYYGGGTTIAQPLVYDYSQPVNPSAQPPSQGVTDQEVALFDQARAAFKSENDASALSLTDQALRLSPNDTTLHEFRALVLFALQRYDEAAASLYPVLSIGPGWDWPTMVGLYSDVAVYTRELRALESYVQQNPQSAAAKFLLAYHYITQGHVDAAIRQLRDVTRLQPRDTISAQLLQQLQGPATGPVASSPAAAQPPAAGIAAAASPTSTSSLKESELVGTWTAQPATDTSISLTITGDGHFAWRVSHQGKTQEFRGDRTYGNGILTLAKTGADAEPPMVGRVTSSDPDHFTFKLIGGAPSDQGLVFTKSP